MSFEISPATTKKLPNYALPLKKSILKWSGMTELSNSYEQRVDHAEFIKVVNS